MRLLGGRSIDGSLRLRLEFDDFEAERIPAPRARILCGLRVRVLNGRNPMTELVLGAGTGSQRLEVADLREIGEAACAGKETHRLHLHAHRTAVLVDVERGIRIGGGPHRIPSLISLRRMKSAAFLIIAFGGGKIESLADRHIVSEKIAGHGLLRRRPAVICRDHIDDARGIVDAHHEWIDALQGHQDGERERAAHSAGPAGGGDPPRGANAATLLRRPVGLPRLGFEEVGLQFRLQVHGRPLRERSPAALSGRMVRRRGSGCRSTGGDGGSIGERWASQRKRCVAKRQQDREQDREIAYALRGENSNGVGAHG